MLCIGHPNMHGVDQVPCLLSVSKDLVISMMGGYRSDGCQDYFSCSCLVKNFISLIALFFLKTH